MTPALRTPIIGAMAAIAATAAMDAVGLSGLGFAALFPLLLVFWAVQRLPAKSLGFAFGGWRHYAMAIAYPLVVVGAIAAVCLATGAADASHLDWRAAGGAFAGALLMTFVLALLTEEGFFRGWLFASLRRTGLDDGATAIWTGIAFALWHLPAVTMSAEDALPLAQVPVLLLNAAVIGATWGLLRAVSKSIVVTSLCHAVWNAAVYVFFGYGTTVGALGVTDTALYGPESGWLGLGVNLVVAGAVWHAWRRRREASATIAFAPAAVG